MIQKLLFKIGQKLRNPFIDSWLLFLKSSEFWTLEDLKKYQLKKLQELVKIAYSKSEYYKRTFDQLNLKPSDIQTLEDLNKLPLITKEDLIIFNNDIHTNLEASKVFDASTSGTSGASLKFKREEKADSFNRASIFRGYSWYGVKPWESNAYFWGFNFTLHKKIKTKILDRFQNRFRIFSYDDIAINKFIKSLKRVSYIHGYSSMIYEIAKKINKKGIKAPLKLKLIKGTSEKIQDTYQEEIQKAFGLKMISEYGAAETGIIAFECPQGNMHINMEGVIVEEVENEIIVTNLQMHSFPIIRYKLGDYIKLAPKNKKCNCGLQHSILEEVTGRIGAVVYGKKKNYPSLYFYYIFKNLVSKYELYLNYKVIQNKRGTLVFFIEQALDHLEFIKLEDEIKNYFKDDIIYEIKMNQILFSKNEKQKSFISNL
jgi:phenylacetate-CoA ligase